MGYLIGSLPMGVIVARVTGGVDPRTVGSGRTGGTNMLRAGGWGRAISVAVLDLSKGALPILIAGWLDAPIEVRALTGVAAVLGSWKSIFLGFHGGRGVATGVGGMLAIAPWIVPFALPAFVVVIWFTRYVSLASILGTLTGALIVVAFMVAGWIDPAWLWYVIPGEAIIWLAHKDNIGRLLAGEERKFQPGDRQPTTPPGTPDEAGDGDTRVLAAGPAHRSRQHQQGPGHEHDDHQRHGRERAVDVRDEGADHAEREQSHHQGADDEEDAPVSAGPLRDESHRPAVSLDGDPDRRHQHPAREQATDASAEAILGTVEGDGHIGPNHRVGGLAGGEVDGGRGVDGQDRHLRFARSHDHVHGRSHRLPQDAADACAQECIDDDPGALDAVEIERHVAVAAGGDAVHQVEPIEPVPVADGIGGGGRPAAREQHDLAGDAQAQPGGGRPRARRRRCCRDHRG